MTIASFPTRSRSRQRRPGLGHLAAFGAGLGNRIEDHVFLDVRELLVVGGLVLRDVEVGEADQLALGRRSGIWTAAIPDVLPWRSDLPTFLPGPDLLPDPPLGQGDHVDLGVTDRCLRVTDSEAAGRWLEPGPLPAELLVPYPVEAMQAWRVGDEAKSSRIEPHAGMAEAIEV